MGAYAPHPSALAGCHLPPKGKAYKKSPAKRPGVKLNLFYTIPGAGSPPVRSDRDRPPRRNPPAGWGIGGEFLPFAAGPGSGCHLDKILTNRLL